MRRIDAPTLRRVAEHHLSRHPSTRANLKRVLERRVASHVRKTGEAAPADVGALIDTVVSAMVELGLVDDLRLASSKARSMRARGKSAIAVRTSLRQKGVETPVVEAVLAAETSGFGAERSRAEVELDAAREWVRRKRLGHHRGECGPEQRRKDLAAVARAGFSFDVARRALVAEES